MHITKRTNIMNTIFFMIDMFKLNLQKVYRFAIKRELRVRYLNN